ncbi:MAG: sulfurtransferase [Bryobacteraceae bacterium]
MNTTALYVACFLLAGTVRAAPACGGHGTRDSMLVSTAWLARHLQDPNLVILSIGQKAEYVQGHIPGALYLEYADTRLARSAAGLTFELPPVADLVEVFGKLGVTNESHVILYFSQDMVSQTTRVFLTLDALGLGSQTSILDGGFPVWQSEGRPVSTERRLVVRGKLEPCPQNDVITGVDYVRANLHHSGVAIVDARDLEYYTGAKHADGQRAGHIPGARGLTYSTLLDESGKFRPPDVLAAMFRDAGIQPGDRVVAYCHIGQQATVVYFVARYLGYDARLYDGSWEDWSAHTELPVETTPEKE